MTQALETRGVHPLHVTHGEDKRWYSTLELYTYTNDPNDSPEVTIVKMLDAIESLDAGAQAVWSVCSLREFNIGYDCGDEPWAFNNGLTNQTLLRIAQSGASLRITIYPERPDTESQRDCPTE